MAKKQTTTWKNRIVGHGNEPLEGILFNPANWRIHPKAQQDALEGVLSQVGWVQDVIVNRVTGHLVDGHLRCQVAARNGEQTIPVVYVDLSEEEEALVLATIDPIAAMAATDKQKLDTLMQSIKSDDERVNALMQEIREKEKIAQAPTGEDKGPQIDKAEELREKWGVEPGQLWQLGEHRLICGDCTDRVAVARVLQGEQVDMILTDPPYGVDYEYAEYKDDQDKHEQFMERVWGSLPSTPLLMLTTGYKHINWFFARGPVGFLVWFDKTKQSPSNIAHLCKSELVIIYGKVYERYAWDTLEIQQPRGDGLRELHTCPKPLELWEKILEPQTRAVTIYEPFCGSGTTIIACEKLHKRARAIEISPTYCAVTLQRFYDMTGITPVLLDS